MNSTHLADQITHHELRSDSTLHVIGVISNPARYHSRYRIYREWLKAMESTPNVKVYTVEATFGDRHFEVTEANNPQHLQLHTKQNIWLKENMINLGVKNLLPKDWKYLAWIDCDVFFRNPNWALETIHQLQHFQVVQPWQDCSDLAFNGGIYQHFKSFGFQHQKRVKKQMHPSQPYQYAHSGFAWACTRLFWENILGLMDFGILGSNDHHMAFGMIGEVKDTIHGKMTASFFRRCLEWQSRAIRVTNCEVGFVNGRIEHQFHGPKSKRLYRERWQIMVDGGFDPDHDLMYDHQGLLVLAGKPRLQHDVLMYNIGRHEDSIEDFLA